MFNDMDSSINSSISRFSVYSINDNQIAIVRTLISVKGVLSHFINGLHTNEINDLHVVKELSVL